MGTAIENNTKEKFVALKTSYSNIGLETVSIFDSIPISDELKIQIDIRIISFQCAHISVPMFLFLLLFLFLFMFMTMSMSTFVFTFMFKLMFMLPENEHRHDTDKDVEPYMST